MQVNIFILEDNLERVATFNMLLPRIYQCDITQTDDVEQAKKILLSKQFDLIFLDHDLGGKVFVDSELPDTGYQIAKFIADNKIKYQQIIIHSMNPIGAQNMLTILSKRSSAVYIPFPLLAQRLKGTR